MEIILAIATILGGMTALWYFWDKFAEYKNGFGHIPYIEPHVLEEIDNSPYRLEPATVDDLAWISGKTAELHGQHSVSYKTKLEWYQANPNGFWIIKNKLGAMVGSCELIPVHESVIAKLIAGNTEEKDKTIEDIVQQKDISSAKTVYLENLMALHDDNTPNSWAFKRCMRDIRKILARMELSSLPVRIYAMSAKEFRTHDGVRKFNTGALMEKLGFTKITETTKQGLPLYAIESKDLGRNVRRMLRE